MYVEGAPTLEGLHAMLQSHVADCYDVRRETNQTLQRLVGKLDNIEKLPMRAVKWIAGVVIVAAITTITTNYVNSQEAASKASQAALAASNAQAAAQQSQAATNSKLNTIIAHQQASAP